MKNTLASVVLMSSLGVSGVAEVPRRTPGPDSQKTNMVLFLADDCTFSDLGCYGNRDSKTPNIDRLASEGMLFERAYQSSAVSSPTRHNLYTGVWPMKTGAYPNHTMAHERTRSIVHHLWPAGYRVALIGKSHIEPADVFPRDLYVDLAKGSEVYLDTLDRFIMECGEDSVPFCVFVASTEPHAPWNKGDASQFDAERVKQPPMYVDIPETREAFVRYLAEINYMDAQVWRVMDILDDRGAADNTAVVFTSEQGNSFPFAKWTCYDQGVHTGFIVRCPGVVVPGSRTSAMVEYVDVVPTFLEIAGAKARGPLDGKSFVGVLEGRKDRHKTYTYSQHTSRGIIAGPEYYGTRAVADRKFRHIVNFTPEVSFRNAETNGKLFKLWVARGEQGDDHVLA